MQAELYPDRVRRRAARIPHPRYSTVPTRYIVNFRYNCGKRRGNKLTSAKTS
jgi:hypothetical protein